VEKVNPDGVEMKLDMNIGDMGTLGRNGKLQAEVAGYS
jgi:hypothetical protein